MCVCEQKKIREQSQRQIVRERGGRGEMGLENALMDFVVRFTHFRFGSLCESFPTGFCMPSP